MADIAHKAELDALLWLAKHFIGLNDATIGQGNRFALRQVAPFWAGWNAQRFGFL